MATADQIGASFSNYQGSAALGGGNFGVVEIDTKPFQTLALYTMFENRAKLDQKQKQIEENAKKLASLTAYNLTTAIPKDREIIQKGYNELFNFVQKNPNVLDYKNNPKGWMEYHKKKNDFENLLEGGKVRSLLYLTREKEISDATNPKEKERLRKELDNEVKSTGLETPLKHTQLYNVTPIAVEAPGMIKLDVTKEGANIIAQRQYDLPDMAGVKAQAQAKSLGFMSLNQDPNSPEYQAQSASGKLEPVESAANISQVLQDVKYKDAKFRNTDGSLNLDLVIKDNANNGLVKGVLTSVKQYNDKMKEMKNAINNKFFEDTFKKPIFFGDGGLDENNYSEIDISDGLQTEEILQMRILGLAKPVSYETKIIQTDNEIQKNNLGLGWYQAKTARINALTPNESTAKPPDLVTQPALLFGEHINRLKGHFGRESKDLIVSFTGTDEITRKALGLEEGKFVTYRKDGTALVNSDANGHGGSPLTIEQQKNNFIIAVKGGSKEEAQLDAKFLGDAETGIQGIFGTTSGKIIWDNWGGTQAPSQATQTTPTPTTTTAPAKTTKKGLPVFK